VWLRNQGAGQWDKRPYVKSKICQGFNSAIQDRYAVVGIGPLEWEKNHWKITVTSSASCVKGAKANQPIPVSFVVEADVDTHNQPLTRSITGSYTVKRKMTNGGAEETVHQGPLQQ
jgi:hypothetical protein